MTPAHFARGRARRALFPLLLAFALASCSSDDDPPLAPEVPDDGDDTPPSEAVIVIGDPRVAVTIDGGETEPSTGAPVTGQFRFILSDSVGRRIFLPDVRLQDSTMSQEYDPFGNPNLYITVIQQRIPTTRMRDTLRFEVRDGGDVTPPFTVRVYPSQLDLPPDSTVLDGTADLVVPWSGRVERVILSLVDSRGMRLRVVFQLENYSGMKRVVVPARDLAALHPGPIQVGTNVLDTEVRLTAGSPRLAVSHETNQRRTWIYAP